MRPRCDTLLGLACRKEFLVAKLRSTTFYILISLILSTVTSIQPSIAAEQIPLSAEFSKVYKPDLASPKSCTKGSLAISRQDGVAFQSSDILEVAIYAYYPEDKKRSSMPVTYSFPKFAYLYESGTLEPRVGSQYELCVDAWQKDYFRPNFSALYFEILYKMNHGSTNAGRFTATIPILPKNEEAKTIEKVQEDCAFTNFEDNAVVTVSPATFKSGANLTVKGTYFIRGVPAPNQPLDLQERIISNLGTSKVVAHGKTVTDSQGVFSFKFKFVQRDDDPMPFFQIVRKLRTSQLGFILGPFEPSSASISFDCDKGKCKYTPGGTYTDFIPEFSPQCLSTFKSYDDAYSSAAAAGAAAGFNFTDSKNRIAWIGRKVFPGSKNKVAFTATWISKDADYPQRDARNLGKSGSSGSSGVKRCYVSGYTTKTGKRVSGYYRSC